ncbi:hypothetical protein HG530_002185 [Fusarium avenaceum]|nr:hypothetical protein HG530_002185 [Fusarium avenaceum]
MLEDSNLGVVICSGWQVVACLCHAGLYNFTLFLAVSIENLERHLSFTNVVGLAKAKREALGPGALNFKVKHAKGCLCDDLVLYVPGFKELFPPFIDETRLHIASHKGIAFTESL